MLKQAFSISKNFEYKWLGFSLVTIFSVLNLILYSHVLALKQVNTIICYNLLKFAFINIFSLCALYFGLKNADTIVDRIIGLAIGEMVLFVTIFSWMARDNFCWKIDFSYLMLALKVGLPLIPGGIDVLISSMSGRFF